MESERQAVISAQELASSHRKWYVASNDSLWAFGKHKVTRLTKEVADGSTKRIARGNSLLICSSTIIRNRSCATLYADKKLIHHHWHGDPHKANLGILFHRILLLYRTRDRLPMKVPQKAQKQRNSDLNDGRKRHYSVLGKSLSAEKWY